MHRMLGHAPDVQFHHDASPGVRPTTLLVGRRQRLHRRADHPPPRARGQRGDDDGEGAEPPTAAAATTAARGSRVGRDRGPKREEKKEEKQGGETGHGAYAHHSRPCRAYTYTQPYVQGGQTEQAIALQRNSEKKKPTRTDNPQTTTTKGPEKDDGAEKEHTGQANTSSRSASTASTPPSSPSTVAKLRKCVGRWASS